MNKSVWDMTIGEIKEHCTEDLTEGCKQCPPALSEFCRKANLYPFDWEVEKPNKKAANADIREEAKAAGVALWKCADRMGITDSHFSRKLRKELPPEEKARIREIIEQEREKE